MTNRQILDYYDEQFQLQLIESHSNPCEMCKAEPFNANLFCAKCIKDVKLTIAQLRGKKILISEYNKCKVNTFDYLVADRLFPNTQVTTKEGNRYEIEKIWFTEEICVV
jgi:hypothetical protein